MGADVLPQVSTGILFMIFKEGRLQDPASRLKRDFAPNQAS